MKNQKDPPSVLDILSHFKFNEIFKLIGIFFGANLFIGIATIFFLFIDKILAFIGIDQDLTDNLWNGFNNYINDLSPYFFGGKFFLTVAIVYIFFLIMAKSDTHYFRNFKFVLKIPILSFPKLISRSLIILFIGFFLGILPMWASLWILFFIYIFQHLLLTNITFQKVYYREFPEEYKLDFGEGPPR